jgi:hypothetical protein
VLLKFLDSVDCDHSVTHASWEHSSYELLPRGTTAAPGGAAANAGHAIIDEIRGCDHTFGDHDEAGCIALVVITAPSGANRHYSTCPPTIRRVRRRRDLPARRLPRRPLDHPAGAHCPAAAGHAGASRAGRGYGLRSPHVSAARVPLPRALCAP